MCQRPPSRTTKATEPGTVIQPPHKAQTIGFGYEPLLSVIVRELSAAMAMGFVSSYIPLRRRNSKGNSDNDKQENQYVHTHIYTCRCI